GRGISSHFFASRHLSRAHAPTVPAHPGRPVALDEEHAPFASKRTHWNRPDVCHAIRGAWPDFGGCARTWRIGTGIVRRSIFQPHNPVCWGWRLAAARSASIAFVLAVSAARPAGICSMGRKLSQPHLLLARRDVQVYKRGPNHRAGQGCVELKLALLV